MIKCIVRICHLKGKKASVEGEDRGLLNVPRLLGMCIGVVSGVPTQPGEALLLTGYD
jgi:hypothetical protein